MSFHINLGKHKYANWTKHEVEQVLWNIGSAAKNSNWIESDLTVSKSNWFSRMMWCVAKHFDWMRKAFYNVDLENSRSILEQLRVKIITHNDKVLMGIFNNAVANFSYIAPNHSATLIPDDVVNPFSSGHNPPNTPSNVTAPWDSSSGKFGPTLANAISPVKTGTSFVDPSLTQSYVKTGSSVSSALLDELAQYNHGKLNPNDAVKLIQDPLHKTGTYLIRQSWDSDNIVVTVLMPMSQVAHIRFKIINDKFRNEDGKEFDKLQDLVAARGGQLLYPIRLGAKHPSHSAAMNKPIQPEASKVKSTIFDQETPVVPPKATTPEPTKLSPEVEYRLALESGKDLNELFHKAFMEDQPAIAAWLLSKGASLDSFKKQIGLIKEPAPIETTTPKVSTLSTEDATLPEEDSTLTTEDGTTIPTEGTNLAAEGTAQPLEGIIPPVVAPVKTSIEIKPVSLSNEQKNLLSWLELVSMKVEAIPANLDHFALKLGMGYKSANLLVMEGKAEQMSKNLEHSIVKVPPFLPVGDFELSNYIKKEIPEVFKLWNAFKDTFDPALKQAYLNADTNEKASKSGMKITIAGEKILHSIVDMIEEHFRTKPYHSLQMREWLAKEKPHFVIIRSTGKEDSDTNSNAGGNASIPFVKPTEKEISENFGVVIASYFGEKSINQRILCGDRSLIEDEKPFLPVLMQEMVGENGGASPKNEDIPRSGVLFTRQSDKAEGVTFINTGLGLNEGVVTSQVSVDSYFVKGRKIHAVVRHKESRFVSQYNDSIGKMGVKPILNANRPLEDSQALHPRQILDLKRVADDISESYAKEKGSPKAMDMEYTVKLKEKGYTKPVIYLLQARPLLGTQGDQKEIKHTYLDLKGLKEIKDDRKITAEVLLDGNAYVRNITDTSSVIFADDLPKGQYDYAHTSDDVKLIVIKKTAPATSHEAVILRPKGVAVLVVDNAEEFAALKKKVGQVGKDNPILVDTQRGIIVSCADKTAAQALIKDGLVSYPIPLELTVPPSITVTHASSILNSLKAENKDDVIKHMLDKFNFSAELLIDNLRGVKTEIQNEEGKTISESEITNFKKIKVTKNEGPKLLDMQSDDGYGLKELFDLMATGDSQEAKLALATVLNAMKNRLKLNMKETEKQRASINIPMFQVFEHALYLARTEIAPAMDKYKAQSLERLYPIKFLNAMIFQKSSPNVMAGHSYGQVLAKDKAQRAALKLGAQNGVKFDGPNAHSLIELQQMISGSFNEECNANWQIFVRDLAKINQVKAKDFISRLVPIINQLNELNITAIWMNTDFNTAWKKYSSSSGEARIESVIQSIEKTMIQDKATFEWIQGRLALVGMYETGESAWIEPKHAQKNTEKLINDFTKEFGFDPNASAKNSIIKNYNSSQSLGRLALLQYIRRAVNAYDVTIKAVKGSDKYKNDNDKALQVADMLAGYLKMMEATMSMIPNSDQQHLQSVSNYTAILFPEYIAKLRNGCSYKFGFSKKHTSSGFEPLVNNLRKGTLNATEQLEARSNFAVDGLVIGSHADLNFSVHWPDRLEEYFTTFHQNMEQVVKFLNTKNGLDTHLLSKLPREICEKSKTKFGQNISYLTQEEGKLRVGYQIPLRQHSANFIIDYDPKKPEKGAELIVQMFGNSEHNRWDWGATYGAILAFTMTDGFVNSIGPKINYKNPEGVEFTLKIPSNYAQIDKLVNTIHYITKVMTMGGNGKPETLIQNMQQGIGPIDWGKLNPECYKYTLHINRTLIQQLLSKSQDETAAKVAIYSILGIASYAIGDYTHDDTGSTFSLLTESLKVIKKLIPKMPTILGDVHKLLGDPDVQKKLPNVCNDINTVLATMLPPEDAFKQFMKEKNYIEAISFAIKLKNPQFMTKIEDLIANKLTLGETDLLVDLVIKLTGLGLESEAENLIMKKGLAAKLTPAQEQKLKILKQKESRAQYLAEINSNVGKMQGLVDKFDENHQEIMKLCVESLIGLSQCPDYQGKSFGGFTNLPNHLGKPGYSYIYDNGYSDTSKLRKAGPLYIIRGMESTNADVRNSAIEAFKKLAIDYAFFAKNEPVKNDIDQVMFALARAYMDNSKRDKTAARDLYLMFQEDKKIIEEMIASGKIPESKKQSLQDVINK
jgi:hypothetical protein